MKHYQSWIGLNIIEAVQEHLDRTKHKAANIQRRALNVIQEAWRTVPEDAWIES